MEELHQLIDQLATLELPEAEINRIIRGILRIIEGETLEEVRKCRRQCSIHIRPEVLHCFRQCGTIAKTKRKRPHKSRLRQQANAAPCLQHDNSTTVSR